MKDNTIGHCRIQIVSGTKQNILKTSSSSAALLTGMSCRDSLIGLSLLDLHFIVLWLLLSWQRWSKSVPYLFNVNSVNTGEPTGSTFQTPMGFITDASADARLARCATRREGTFTLLQPPTAPRSSKGFTIELYLFLLRDTFWTEEGRKPPMISSGL